MAVDAYAVTHPGHAGAQATPSVWIHLVTLCFVLERGWPVDRAVMLRRVAADAFDRWPWLDPPMAAGGVSAMDVAVAVADKNPIAAQEVTRSWVEGAWDAWAELHPAIRIRADDLSRLLC